MNWYKDRDFPEIKRSRYNEPSEILAVVENPKDLLRLIEVHNSDINDYEEALRDKRRLTRELDIALSGADGAAEQASLCDLIGPAKELREERDRLKIELNHAYEDGFKKAKEMAIKLADESPLHCQCAVHIEDMRKEE